MPTPRFPGVYVNVIDQSFFAPTQSRWSGALLGVTERGPFNQVLACPSTRDYNNNFGKIAGDSLVPVTAVLLAQMTNGLYVGRVGNQYDVVDVNTGSGTLGATVVNVTDGTKYTQGQYVRVREAGKNSTLDALITSPPVGNVLNLDTGLAATYSGAEVSSSDEIDGANEAEGFLYGGLPSAVSGVTVAAGTRGQYTLTFTHSASPPPLVAGDIITISQPGVGSGAVDKLVTYEALVKTVTYLGTSNWSIKLDTSDNGKYGTKAIALADTYTAATIEKYVASDAGDVNTVPCIQIGANTAGTWANSTNLTSGVVVRIAPGSRYGTKKLTVYYAGAAVEIFDNWSVDALEDLVNGDSQFVTVTVLDPNQVPLNTREPWLSTNLTVNVAQLDGGRNGSNPTPEDYIGELDPNTGVATGLKMFENFQAKLDVIAIPGVTETDGSMTGVFQELGRVCSVIYAVAPIDVPATISAAGAIDWHNADGLYTSTFKFDTSFLAYVFNWGTVINPYTGEVIAAPPSFGFLRAMIYTFDNAKPWYAIAGEKRGLVPEFLDVEFKSIRPDTLDAMYGPGPNNTDASCVNPILWLNGRAVLFGQRTSQRTESKLTAVNNRVLVNTLVRGLGNIGRQFTFDPIDAILLSDIKAAYTTYLDNIVTDRGIEQYALEVLADANDRNNRQVRVNLAFVPTDAAERILITATVRESGASLTSVA